MKTMMKRLAVVATVLVLAAGCWAPSATPDYSYTVTSNVVYGQGEINGGGSYKNLVLDLYKPTDTGQEKLPLVVMIHGGGFVGGSKTNGNTVTWARALAERGYLVASINYRLSGDSPIPSERVQNIYNLMISQGPNSQEVAATAAMDDTLTALDFLHARADVDPAKTVLMGSSAGAITAVWVAYGLDDFYIARPPVAAVVSNWGGFMAFPANSMMDPGEPPLFMAHTTGDPTVPYSQSTDMVAAATAAGIENELYTQVSNSHGFNIVAEQYSPGVSVLQAEINFLTCQLYDRCS